MKIKLHWKLTFIFCLAVLVGLFAGYVYLIGHLRSYVENNLENDLRRQLFLGRDYFEERLDRTGSLSDAGPLAAKIGKTLNARVTVITNDGTVIADTDLDQPGIKRLENHLDRPEIRDARLRDQ
jgi:two-component system phosphate regulon sensor histidine kinase PhoR